MNKFLKFSKLEGKLVVLDLLTKKHQKGLLQAAQDGELWNLWYTFVPSENSMNDYIQTALEGYQNDTILPFVIIDNQKNQVIGSTRFCNAECKNRRLELGYTWYAKSYQRTGVNTECKYLLLTYAFEVLECIAVEFRTHWHNISSRKAINRLGAKQDGVLRNHQIDKFGIYRDTVVFSIIQNEWLAVKKSLEYKMQQKYD